jgi:O-antigen ligase
MAIFLFPVLLLLNRLDLRRYREKLFFWFSLSCILSACFLFQDAFRTIAYYHLPLSALYTEQFLNHNFSAPLGIHATYLSMYAALSVYWLMLQLYRPLKPKIRWLVVAGLVILVAALIQLSSRAVMISLLVTASVIFPLFHAHGRQRMRTLLITVPVLLLLLVVILATPVLRERFYDDLRSDLSSTSLPYTTADPRGERWKLALALIQRSPLIGYGSGDEVDRLQDTYFNHKLYHSYLFKLNAHNQYFSFLLRSGIAGLLVWLATLFVFIRLAYKTKDLLFFSFILLLSIVGLSENFLDVNKGIFFYAFFAGLFTVAAMKRKGGAVSRELRGERSG